MPGQPLALDALSEGWPAGARLVPFATKHRVKSLGYRLELPRAGKFSPEQAQALGVPVQQWKMLQKGQSVAVEGRTVQPAQVLGAPRKGLSVVFSGDTAPCPYYLQAAHDADLLICDATYALPEQEDQARQWGHSTFGQERDPCRAGEGKAALADPLFPHDHRPGGVCRAGTEHLPGGGVRL